MKERIYNPAGYNDKAPQPGMASVDTDNADERQQEDKKQTASIKEKQRKYDERERKGTTADEDLPGD